MQQEIYIIDDDDSSIRICKNTFVYSNHNFWNVSIYFYYAIVLQYDFSGCCIFRFSWSRNYVQIKLIGDWYGKERKNKERKST